MKVTTESLTEAAASLKTQATRLDEISCQLSRIESQLRQSSTNLDSQIQSIERQRKNVEQYQQTLSQLVRTLNSAAEQYQKCEQDAITGSTSTDIDVASETKLPVAEPLMRTGYTPFRLIAIRLNWPLSLIFAVPIRMIWVRPTPIGPKPKPTIPFIPIRPRPVGPVKPVRPVKPVVPSPKPSPIFWTKNQLLISPIPKAVLTAASTTLIRPLVK